jgi:hypothetical protein
VLALRFANADVFPFDAASYGNEVARYAEELGREPSARELSGDLAGLARQASAWSQAAGATQTAALEKLQSGRAATVDRAAVNGWLLALERGLLDAQGLPARPWFRHLIYAPLPSYAAETLPAVREAAVSGDLPAARRAIANLQEKLAALTEAARAAGEPGAPAPAEASKAAVLQGTITDAECGADHGPMLLKGGMGANARDCTLACAAKGTPYGFVEARTGRFYQLDEGEKAAPFAGKTVSLTGRTEGDTIRVESVAAAGKSR